MAVIIFAASFVLLLYHLAGYPLCLKWIAKKQIPIQPGASVPLNHFVFVIPMYNEAQFIERKIANFAALDWPADQYEIWLLNDGSTDNTLELANKAVKNYPDLRVRFLSAAVNQGKVAWFNQVVANIPADCIVFFSDVSASLSDDILQKANAWFNNPRVGAFCARYVAGEQEGSGEQYYWQYQNDIKISESRLGTPIGYHGTGYAIRRSLWAPIPHNTINDDFVIPLQAILRAHQDPKQLATWGVYDPSALAREGESVTSDQVSMWRRIRVASGNIQQAFILWRLLSPRLGWVAWMFFSGKVLRIFTPWLLLSLFISAACLAPKGGLYPVIFYAQLLFYLTGMVCTRHFAIIRYFVQGQYAMLVGWFYFFKLNKTGRWRRVNKKMLAPYRHPLVRAGKCVIDIVFVLIGLPILVCLIPIIAVLIKSSSPGPIFYKQLRVGLGDAKQTRFFYVYKFRTMSVSPEGKGARWTAKNDQRVIRFGEFMRKTHIDELPQLINILKRDMTLIGPRPERLDAYPYVVKNIPLYAERLYEVRPGLTGLAQVTYGYDRTIARVRRRVAVDLAYGTYLTRPWIWFKTDMCIIFKTIRMIVFGKEP